jgi:hypothetical protein
MGLSVAERVGQPPNGRVLLTQTVRLPPRGFEGLVNAWGLPSIRRPVAPLGRRSS